MMIDEYERPKNRRVHISIEYTQFIL